jgi:molecular chaperone HtpG
MAKKQFKAESKRLLDLMINSIYTHKEIFLREIVSNASDAIDKLAYLSLTDDQVGLNRDDFKIRLSVDKERGVLTVSDNGIGMSKAEMEENLGTIAKSGSLQFKQEMEQKDDVDIIGQFGVGFYSAFMVAEAVTVISKKYGSDEAWMWQSSGADGYTMTACEKETVGTDVIMKLKPDTEDEDYSEYLTEYKLRQLIKKYSDYIHYPIQMEVEKTRYVPDPEDSEKQISETYTEDETFNSMVPIWQRPKSEVTQEEYDSFYKDKFMDYDAPLSTLRVSVEGAVSYTALLFIPSKTPYDYYTKEYKKGLQLYSSGVMIMDSCEELLPDCFRFVKGVVDSQDLSLNISREMLQHDRAVKIIATNLEKKIKAELEKLLKNDREKYETFFSAFGLQLKYGVAGNYGEKKDQLQDLLLFWSAKQSKLVTLAEYVEAMPEGQESIYYVVGDNRTRLTQLPQTELALGKGYDVLLMTEEVDEFCAQIIGKYQEKTFQSVIGSDLGTSDETEQPSEEETKPVLDFAKETLGERVASVRLSQSLGTHPVSLVPGDGMSFEMEKYFNRVDPENTMKSSRILELNAGHNVFHALETAIAEDPEKAKQYVELLYSQALLMADLPIEDPTAYTDLVCSLIR